ncbi:MAG TPA: hypothetical protein VEQ59_06655, partial [Polyangiaceae bacterium]|nr:hypothetical protein [Polyangiaceae bacterium]
MPGSRFVRGWSAVGALLVACAEPPIAPTKPPTVVSAVPEHKAPRPAELAEEPEPTAPELRLGKLAPIEHGEPLRLT